MKIKLKKQKGFTLIEVLIALTIFMIFITSISASYLDIARSQREANAVREIYSDIRYVFNLIEEEARSKTIDYACYQKGEVPEEYNGEDLIIDFSRVCAAAADITDPTEYLALIDSEGINRTIFKIENNSAGDGKIFTIYKEHYTGGGFASDPGFKLMSFTPMDLKNLKINSFKFEISPMADPFDPELVACGPVQFQPMVTVYTTVEGAKKETSQFKMNLETSISSRVYNKKTTL